MSAATGNPTRPAVPDGSATAANILALLQAQHAALTRTDAGGAEALDAVGRQLGDALAALFGRQGARPGGPPRVPPGLEPATIESIRQALQINQRLLARVSHQNRQGLDLLFGEPGVYQR